MLNKCVIIIITCYNDLNYANCYLFQLLITHTKSTWSSSHIKWLCVDWSSWRISINLRVETLMNYHYLIPSSEAPSEKVSTWVHWERMPSRQDRIPVHQIGSVQRWTKVDQQQWKSRQIWGNTSTKEKRKIPIGYKSVQIEVFTNYSLSVIL